MYYKSGFIAESLTRGGGTTHTRNLGGGGGGNMKTHVAVYKEGLFDLRGAKLFKGGANAPSRSAP